MQFHPLAYIVKLKIELSMAELIAKIAKHRDPQGNGGIQDFYQKSSSGGRSKTGGTALANLEAGGGRNKAWATVTTTLEMKTMDASGKEVKRPGADGLSDSDTDSLIDPAAVYAGTAGTESVAPRNASHQGGGSSMSSYNTYAEGRAGVHQE
ncbi:hypothetical protein LIA77_08244 [Sarocladium implicatum]|nr:hypothetical protein LIA77_08244 [Sarocladium implicatum]